MAIFKDETEVYTYIGGIFEEALADPVLCIDMPSKKVLYGEDARNGPKPVVEMSMKADVAHRFWLGKVNITAAMAKGQVKAKGPIPKILKLVPLTKILFPRYRDSLVRSGRSDLV